MDPSHALCLVPVTAATPCSLTIASPHALLEAACCSTWKFVSPHLCHARYQLLSYCVAWYTDSRMLVVISGDSSHRSSSSLRHWLFLREKRASMCLCKSWRICIDRPTSTSTWRLGDLTRATRYSVYSSK